MKITVEIDEGQITKEVVKVVQERMAVYFRDSYGRLTEQGSAVASMVNRELAGQGERIRLTIAAVVDDGLDAAVREETAKAMRRVARAKVKAAEQLGILDVGEDKQKGETDDGE